MRPVRARARPGRDTSESAGQTQDVSRSAEALLCPRGVVKGTCLITVGQTHDRSVPQRVPKPLRVPDRLVEANRPVKVLDPIGVSPEEQRRIPECAVGVGQSEVVGKGFVDRRGSEVGILSPRVVLRLRQHVSTLQQRIGPRVTRRLPFEHCVGQSERLDSPSQLPVNDGVLLYGPQLDTQVAGGPGQRDGPDCRWLCLFGSAQATQCIGEAGKGPSKAAVVTDSFVAGDGAGEVTHSARLLASLIETRAGLKVPKNVLTTGLRSAAICSPASAVATA